MGREGQASPPPLPLSDRLLDTAAHGRASLGGGPLASAEGKALTCGLLTSACPAAGRRGPACRGSGQGPVLPSIPRRLWREVGEGVPWSRALSLAGVCSQLSRRYSAEKALGTPRFPCLHLQMLTKPGLSNSLRSTPWTAPPHLHLTCTFSPGRPHSLCSRLPPSVSPPPAQPPGESIHEFGSDHLPPP